MARAKMVDMWARAEEGDLIEEKHFDLKIFWKSLKRITKEHGIEYDKEHLIPGEDSELLDRLFQAGKDISMVQCELSPGAKRVLFRRGLKRRCIARSFPLGNFPFFSKINL